MRETLNNMLLQSELERLPKGVCYFDFFYKVLTIKAQITCRASVSFVSHYNRASPVTETIQLQCNRLRGMISIEFDNNNLFLCEYRLTHAEKIPYHN